MTESTPSSGRLGDLLPGSAVAAHVEAADWRAAIRATGDLLVSTGSATPSYTEQMIAAIDKFGPYIVIAPGFALAHAQASDDVLHTGMSFVQLAQPVPFGHKTNDPVHLVVGLASKDHDAHMEALQQLAGFLSDQEVTEKLRGAADADELRALLGLLPTSE
ncbi:MAG: PTS sugar transporter subunit IIAB [Actinobacteria bacterium HGW-Actinobacteria-8]|nr:MAG: PTS sugar transporter subunit IIAB [Actinobacteria bacterium HGW-Actinobacteria-8]